MEQLTTNRMKKYSIILLCLLLLVACTSENAEDLSNKQPCEEVSYANDIQPVIDTNCALSGCHAGNNGLPDFTVKSEVFDNATSIKFRTSNRTMPPSSIGLTLTNEEIENIACWVDAGTPDN